MMKNQYGLICSVLFAALLIAGPLWADDPAPEPFTFVQVCDTQLGFGGYDEDVAAFEQAVRQINELAPSFVIICGDLVNQMTEESAWNDFIRINSGFEMPCHLVAGNHDVGNNVPREALAAYRERFGSDQYSFTHRGSTFVIVNTCLWKFPIESETPLQNAWLRKTLGEASGPVFIAGHHPLFLEQPDEDEAYYNLEPGIRGELLDLYVDSGVVAVLGGHTHKRLILEYGGMVLVNGETTSKNFDNRPRGFRLWTVEPDGTAAHIFVPLTRPSLDSGLFVTLRG